MRHVTMKLPAPKPRNSIVQALIRKVAVSGAGRHVRAQNKRKSNHDDTDLAQRVRECGEW